MHIHILGVCGTFMAGIAVIAKQMGHQVSGSDASAKPPMSTQLEEQGIQVMEGYTPEHLNPRPDLVIVGNAISRGNPALEYILNERLAYMSGPQWLYQGCLKDRWVLGVSGTHGKTTTTSMLAWVLEFAGLKPGFLVGGVPENFGVSARVGESPFFVIESDEYDTAFDDKRSKFLHYHPRTLIINNLEFDHADIFEDLAAIQKQFHHLVRCVPGQGLILAPKEAAIEQTLSKGCWTPTQWVGESQGWHVKPISADFSHYAIYDGALKCGEVRWNTLGEHNAKNGLMAILAARHAGVSIPVACEALGEFKSVKRRLEIKGTVAGVTVYDDFAHHPTAIEVTIEALRGRVGAGRILAVLEPRSNTMRMGVHQAELAESLKGADARYLLQPSGLGWSLDAVFAKSEVQAFIADNTADLVARVASEAQAGDSILVMSNGFFDGIHQKLLDALAQKG